MAKQYARPSGGPELSPIVSDSFNRDTTGSGIGTTDGAATSVSDGDGHTWEITTTGKTARIDDNKCKAVGNILASDSFDRADSASIGSTDGNWPSAGSGGASKAWIEAEDGGGAFKIVSNTLQLVGASNYGWAVLDTSASDVTLECNKIGTASTNYGRIILRYVDNNNYWVVSHSASASTLYILEYASAVWYTRSSTSATWDASGNNKMIVGVSGTAITAKTINSSTYTSSFTMGTQTAASLYATKHGLSFHPTDAGWDNIVIWSTDIPIASDSFDRDDSASLGSTDGDWPYADAGGDGLAWSQSSDEGRTYELVDNGVQDDTPSSYGWCYANADAGEEDVTVECNFIDTDPPSRVPGWQHGNVILRYIDNDNLWQVYGYQNQGMLTLGEKRLGSWFTRAQHGYMVAPWAIDGTKNKIVASCIGEEITGRLSNNLAFSSMLTYTDVSGAAKSTKHGFGTYCDFNRIDSIAMFPYSSRATGVIDTSEDTSTTSGELCRMDINYGATDGSPDDLLYVATLNYSSEYQCFRIALNDNSTGPLSIYEVDGNIASTYLRASDTTGYTWHKDGTINKVQCGVQKKAIWAKLGESFVWYYADGVDDGYTKHGWIISDDNVYVDSIAMYPLTQWLPLGYIAASPEITPSTPLSIPVASDSFERADSASLGTTDGAATAVSGGSGLTWNQWQHGGASALAISSNAVAAPTNDQYAFAMTHLDTGVRNVVLEANVTETHSTNGGALIIGRYISDDNFWYAGAFSTWGGAVYLYQYGGSTPTWYSRGQTNSADCWLAPGTNKLVAVFAGDMMGVGVPDTTGAWIWNSMPDSTDYSYATSAAAGFGCGLYYNTTAMNNWVCWPTEYYPQLVDDSDDTYLYVHNNPLGLFTIDDMPLRLKLDDSIVDPEEASSLILASDSFDRADVPFEGDLGETDGNWPSADTGGDGLAWIKSSTDPENGRVNHIVLKDDTLQLVMGSYNMYEHATVETGESDVVVETNQGSLVQVTSGTYGELVLRYVDDDNFWICMLWAYTANGGTAWIYEKTAGTWVSRNSTTEMGWDTTGFNKLRGTVAGLNISFGVAGEGNQSSYTMPSPIHATGTRHGVTIYSHANWIQVQNISIWKATSTYKVVIRAEENSSGRYPTIKMDLRQGNTSIASETFSLTTSPADYTMTLSGVEVNDITDYDELYLILTADGSNNMAQHLYGAHFQVGDDTPAGGGGAQTRFMLLGVG